MRSALYLLLILFLFFSAGCYTLRKKFIRKKQFKKEKPVYVDFKEYPQKPSREAYLTYYLFVRGWLDELKESLISEQNVKRQRYAINQAIMNVEQIISFYNLEGKESIYPLYAELLEIRRLIESGPRLGQVQRNLVISKIEHFKRNFDANFSYQKIEEWLK